MTTRTRPPSFALASRPSPPAPAASASPVGLASICAPNASSPSARLGLVPRRRRSLPLSRSRRRRRPARVAELVEEHVSPLSPSSSSPAARERSCCAHVAAGGGAAAAAARAAAARAAACRELEPQVERLPARAVPVEGNARADELVGDAAPVPVFVADSLSCTTRGRVVHHERGSAPHRAPAPPAAVRIGSSSAKRISTYGSFERSIELGLAALARRRRGSTPTAWARRAPRGPLATPLARRRRRAS